MAPHSSTLAWKIPWTEEPGRLQSMGSLRVGHDWATSLSLFTFMHWRREWQPPPVFLPGESQGQRSLVGCRLWGRTWLKRLSSSSSSSRASLVIQTVRNPPAMWETGVRSLGWGDPLEEDMATHSSILAWRIPMDRGAWWVTYSPWGRKQSDMTERLSTAQLLKSHWGTSLALQQLRFHTFTEGAWVQSLVGPSCHTVWPPKQQTPQNKVTDKPRQIQHTEYFCT